MIKRRYGYGTWNFIYVRKLKMVSCQQFTLCAAMKIVFNMLLMFHGKGNCQIIPTSSSLPTCCTNLKFGRNDIK
jgi:hypothetical protein